MATLKIVLKDKALSSGLFPIYLRVTKDRKRKFISTGYSCEKSQWNETKSEFRKNYPNFSQKNAALMAFKNRAEKIFSDATAQGKDVSLEEFEQEFFNFKKNSRTVV